MIWLSGQIPTAVGVVTWPTGWRTSASARSPTTSFHEYQVDLAGNSFISDMYRKLSIHQLMERTILVLGVHAAGASSAEHEEIYAAFAARDLERARAALRANVVTGKRIVRQTITQTGATL